MIFDWNLRPRKHRTNADLIGAISPKKPFSSIMRYIVLWRHLWRYRINANIKTWYPQKPHILTFTLIPSSFFSDHCVKLYRWMCITFQMPLVYLRWTSCLISFVWDQSTCQERQNTKWKILAHSDTRIHNLKICSPLITDLFPPSPPNRRLFVRPAPPPW